MIHLSDVNAQENKILTFTPTPPKKPSSLYNIINKFHKYIYFFFTCRQVFEQCVTSKIMTNKMVHMKSIKLLLDIITDFCCALLLNSNEHQLT